MPPLALALAVLTALALGYGWHRSAVARAVEGAAAQHSADSLMATIAVTRSDAALRHRTDSLAHAAAQQRHAAALVATRRDADAGARAHGRLLDSLAALSPDTMSPFVSRLLADWQAHLDADLRERQAADSSIASLRGDLAALEASYATDLGACGAQVDEALRQLRAANARSNPSLVSRIVRTASVVLVTIGAWEGLKRL